MHQKVIKINIRVSYNSENTVHRKTRDNNTKPITRRHAALKRYSLDLRGRIIDMVTSSCIDTQQQEGK